MIGRDPWPSVLRAAVERKDLVLVVGAGVSINSTDGDGNHPPKWSDLITEMSLAAGASEKEQEAIDDLVSSSRMLEAAELVKAIANRHSKLADIKKHLKRAVDGSPKNEYQPSEWHHAILMLEPNIIITTNYDKIIERSSKAGYAMHRYESKTLGREVRGGDPVLLKLHGCVDDVENVIITRSDYSSMHYKARHALDVVRALLLTRVALFVGYSMGDPDIQLLLENTVGGNIQSPSHFLLTGDDIRDYEKNMVESSYGVSPIVYPEGEHQVALEYLQLLAPTA